MNKIHKYFMDVCKRTAELSTCSSRKVGCILVKNKRIIACGYNGVPSGKKHCNEMFDESLMSIDKQYRFKHHEWSQINELHAEQNLICFCAKNGIKTEDTILFVTLSPCINCSKMILSAGIKKVFYLEEYDLDDEGIKFLKRNNVKIEKFIY